MQNMIEVQNVSMRFNLGIEKNNSLKQIMVDLLSKKAREERKARKKQNEFWALSDVSFTVERGEVVGFVGSNGAGKSTLLKVVAGVMKPTKGQVLSAGNICPMIELGAGFDMDLNARENIYLNGAVMGYSREFLDGKFQEIVDFSELHDFLDVPVKNFSSGMIARLAFSLHFSVENSNHQQKVSHLQLESPDPPELQQKMPVWQSYLRKSCYDRRYGGSVCGLLSKSDFKIECCKKGGNT